MNRPTGQLDGDRGQTKKQLGKLVYKFSSEEALGSVSKRNQRIRSMSKMSVVVLCMVIGLILELMMMVLFTIGVVKLLIVYPNHNDHSGREHLWMLYVLVGVSVGGIVSVSATIVLCCWWRRNKTMQIEAKELPIIPNNSANSMISLKIRRFFFTQEYQLMRKALGCTCFHLFVLQNFFML
ncbi:hypothetical protein FRX31_015426, partial [Thalictrum thalictroides]